jgi:hypothetical protein
VTASLFRQAMIRERMIEHSKVAEWETDWDAVDELSVHEEIHCRPCRQWERRRCAHAEDA